MTYVITDLCCKDNVCIELCPEEAISAGTVEVGGTVYDQLFIDPAKCADCALCESECEPGAIFAEDDLPADKKQFAAINAAFFKQ